MACMVARRCTQLLENTNDEEESEFIQDHQKLSPSFMDRLANKPYLDSSQKGTRPPAVPQTLRLMTVDLTAVREKGVQNSDDCKMVWNALPHGATAPKRVLVSSLGGREAPIDIEQKVWVRAFHQCYYNSASEDTKKVGIEIMEADTASLNPSNLRRMHSLIRYDHGKYAKRIGSKPKQGKEEEESLEDLEDVDPREAPWNQQAWIEEVVLRIGGKVRFGEPMQAPKDQWWYRWRKSGLSYRSTIPITTGTWWDLFTYIEPAGMDGAAQNKDFSSNWASERPHAVIANGAVLQRMPQALRLLQQVCKDHDVPLYVLHDPRRWGGNTHESLGDVLEDVRKMVKRRVIDNSLNYSAGRPFARGRRWGQLETEAKWNLRAAKRQANNLLERAVALKNQRQQEDWSRLDADTLVQRLARHGLLQIEKDLGRIKVASPGMQEIARKWLLEDEADDDKKTTHENIGMIREPQEESNSDAKKLKE